MRLFFGRIGGFIVLIACAIVLFAISNLTATAEPGERAAQMAAPAIQNGSFESNLTGWEVTGTVNIRAGSTITNKALDVVGAADGSQALDLGNGSIEQTVSGFVPDQTYVLRIDYRGNTTDESIKDAMVTIDGNELTQGLFGGDPPGIHSKEENDWVVCNGFEFTPESSTVTLIIESEESSTNGLLIDNVRFLDGGITQPPEHSFNTLTDDGDGWRLLENGSFEQSVASLNDPENTGPDSGNPHLCGDSIPGWRVTRENTDRIEGANNGSQIEEDEWNPPDGTKIIDVGGHGPGGIAQTITGLVAGGTYELEFEAARHRFWGSDTMTTELWANGQEALSFSRTISQKADDGYITESVDLIANEDGKITFEIFSTNIDKGGNNVMDNFRIRLVSTPTPTNTPSPTNTPLPTSTPTLTPTPLPTNTPTPTATFTQVPTNTPTPAFTAMPTSTVVSTPTPSETPDGTTNLDEKVFLPIIINLASSR
ncbi:MAG: DUF642 domain-containing protein [Chloroflexota bacterium]